MVRSICGEGGAIERGEGEGDSKAGSGTLSCRGAAEGESCIVQMALGNVRGSNGKYNPGLGS